MVVVSAKQTGRLPALPRLRTSHHAHFEANGMLSSMFPRPAAQAELLAHFVAEFARKELLAFFQKDMRCGGSILSVAMTLA